MLHLSKKVDYALLALSYLARADSDRPVNTKEIAEHFDIPVEFLAKVLQQLTRAEMLTSIPGPAGGYHLAVPAERISVGCVVRIIDGPPAIMPCLRVGHGGCEQLNRCTVREPLAKINERISEMLNSVSLAEISR